MEKAKPLFDGHYQPRIPLNVNYYNLSDPETMRWQVDLAKKYGVYGWCLYHYWFNGKLLLEKPVEHLLEDKTLDIHFCLSWANEPWTNGWVAEKAKVLIAQRYGREKEWKEHFNYLLPFFWMIAILGLRHYLEVRLHPGELSEPGKDPRIAVSAGNVDRFEVVARNQTRVPDRLLERGVVRLDVEHDVIRRGRCCDYRRYSGSKPARDLAVVPTDAVEADDRGAGSRWSPPTRPRANFDHDRR